MKRSLPIQNFKSFESSTTLMCSDEPDTFHSYFMREDGSIVKVVSVGRTDQNPNIPELNHDDNEVMLCAMRVGDDEKVLELLPKIDLNKRYLDDFPLNNAIFYGLKFATIEKIIEAKADINNQNSLDEDPLDVALEKGNIEVANLLLSKGAVLGNDRYKPAHPPESIEFLVAKETDIKKFELESAGQTPDYDGEA